MFFIFIIMNMVVTAKTESHGVVFVNQKSGVDSKKCGEHNAPCKTLVRGVQQVQDSGMLYINGTIHVYETIKLNKSISVRGIQKTNVIILPSINTKGNFAFESTARIRLEFYLLEISRISLIHINVPITFTISRCKFYGPTTEPYIFSSLPASARFLSWSKSSIGKGIRYRISDSVISNSIKPIEIIPSASYVVERTVFSKTGVISFGNAEPGVVRNSIFYDTRTIVTLRCYSLSIHSCILNYTRGIVVQDSYFFKRQGWRTMLSITNTIIDRSNYPGLSVLYVNLVRISNIKLRNHHVTQESKAPLEIVGSGLEETSTLATIQYLECNNTIYNYAKGTKGGCVALVSVKEAIILRSNFTNTEAKHGGAIHVQNTKLAIRQCVFSNNRARFGGSISTDSETDIKHSLFIGNEARIGGSIFGNPTSDSYFFIDSCTFVNSRCHDKGGGIYLWDFNANIVNCRFERNSASFLGSAIMAEKESRKNHILVTSSKFVNCTASAVSIRSKTISITNTTFDTTDDTVKSQLEIKGEKIYLNSIKSVMNYPKKARSNIILGLINILSPSKVDTSNGLDMSCSSNFKPDVVTSEVKNRTKLEARCISCPLNTYTLSNRLVYQTTRDLQQCLTCPTGAVCDGSIDSLDNFWGKEIGNKLTLYPCPIGFCCSSQTTPCASFNTCKKGRTGAFCGTCADGYVQAYMSEECIPKGERGCNVIIFILYFVLGSNMYTILLSFLPKLIDCVKKAIQRCKTSRSADREVIEESQESEIISDAGESEEKPLPIGAVLTLVVFFFQIASLVHVETLRSTRKDEPGKKEENEIVEAVFDAFNFRFTLYQEVCPFSGLNFVTKMFVTLGLKLNTMISLIWYLIIWKVCTSCISRNQNDQSSSTIIVQETNEEKIELSADLEEVKWKSVSSKNLQNKDSVLPFTSLIKIGFIKLFKLNFTAVVGIVFHLIHCERAGTNVLLYRYGEQFCYTWWQYVIFATLLPILLLFPLSFGLSLDLLHLRKISTKTFVLSFMMPFIPFSLQMKNRNQKLSTKAFDDAEEKCATEILEQEQALFRSDENSIRWSTVQLYRNLLVVIIDTFVLSAVYKTLCFSVLFMSFALHDGLRMPFKHPYLNQLQRLTSVSLFLVNICCVPSSFSSVGNVMAVPNMDMCLTVLRYFEISLYLIVPLSFPAWKIWIYAKDKSRKWKDNETEEHH